MNHVTRPTFMSAVAGLFIATGFGGAHAAVHIVTASGLVFSPDEITIARGDTVRWVLSDGLHTVTSGSGSGDPHAAELFNAPLDESHPTFQFRFLYSGDVPYFCAPHELYGMNGVVHVTPGPLTFRVQVLAFSFLPDSINVETGDTVLWQRMQGTHTVTSGFGPSDPGSARLFRGALNQFGGPHTFSYTFSDTVGVYPYYCELHTVEGMDGRVRVVPSGLATTVELEFEKSWGWVKGQYRHMDESHHH